MTSQNSDAWLWVGLAVLGYYAALTVHRQLLAIRQASEINYHEKPHDVLSQHTENALKLETLGQLAQSANQDIRAASVKIITERAIQGGPAWNLMLRDIAGSNTERRDKALTCFRFLAPPDRHTWNQNTNIYCHKTYKALTDCLCNLLPEARSAEATHSFRTQAERDSLWILDYILSMHFTPASSFAEAIEAGVVSRWLARYPFGGADAPQAKKKEVIREIVNGQQDGDLYYEDTHFGSSMRNILYTSFRVDEFRKEMQNHGLIDYRERDDEDDDTGLWPVVLRANNRHREESLEEQALRRRRREAMVLGRNDRPIQREDIFERDTIEAVPEPEVLDEEVEEELEQLIGQVTETCRNNRSWRRWFTRLRPDGLAPDTF